MSKDRPLLIGNGRRTMIVLVGELLKGRKSTQRQLEADGQGSLFAGGQEVDVKTHTRVSKTGTASQVRQHRSHRKKAAPNQRRSRETKPVPPPETAAPAKPAPKPEPKPETPAPSVEQLAGELSPVLRSQAAQRAFDALVSVIADRGSRNRPAGAEQKVWAEAYAWRQLRARAKPLWRQYVTDLSYEHDAEGLLRGQPAFMRAVADDGWERATKRGRSKRDGARALLRALDALPADERAQEEQALRRMAETMRIWSDAEAKIAETDARLGRDDHKFDGGPLIAMDLADTVIHAAVDPKGHQLTPWGYADPHNARVAAMRQAAGKDWIYDPRLGERVPLASPHPAYEALGRSWRASAAKMLADRGGAVTLTRGVIVPREVQRAVFEGKVRTIPASGVSAFSEDAQYAASYSVSWSEGDGRLLMSLELGPDDVEHLAGVTLDPINQTTWKEAVLTCEAFEVVRVDHAAETMIVRIAKGTS